MLSRLLGVVEILVVIFGFHVLAFLLLPSLARRHASLTLIVSVFLTAVVMKTPWWYVISSIAGYVLETAYLLLLWILVSFAVAAVLGMFLPSSTMDNDLTTLVIIGLTVLLRTPCGSILEAVCLLLLWFLVFISIVTVAVRFAGASAMDRHPSLTLVFLLGLTLLITRMLWGMPGTEEIMKVQQHKRDMEKMMISLSGSLAEEMKSIKRNVVKQGRIQEFVLCTVVILLLTLGYMIKTLIENSDELINTCVAKGEALAKEALGRNRCGLYHRCLRLFLGPKVVNRLDEMARDGRLRG